MRLANAWALYTEAADPESTIDPDMCMEYANKKMLATEDIWENVLAGCDVVHDDFAAIQDEIDSFMARDDWQSLIDSNYAANKEYVDSQWSQALWSWNHGVYFNAAMFYARVWDVVSVVPVTAATE